MARTFLDGGRRQLVVNSSRSFQLQWPVVVVRRRNQPKAEETWDVILVDLPSSIGRWTAFMHSVRIISDRLPAKKPPFASRMEPDLKPDLFSVGRKPRSESLSYPGVSAIQLRLFRCKNALSVIHSVPRILALPHDHKYSVRRYWTLLRLQAIAMALPPSIEKLGWHAP